MNSGNVRWHGECRACEREIATIAPYSEYGKRRVRCRECRTITTVEECTSPKLATDGGLVESDQIEADFEFRLKAMQTGMGYAVTESTVDAIGTGDTLHDAIIDYAERARELSAERAEDGLWRCPDCDRDYINEAVNPRRCPTCGYERGVQR